MNTVVRWTLAAALGATALTASAVDLSFSGFGTIGYARSDQPYSYERFVNERGTFKRDSLLGLQMDAKLNDEFSATLQGKVAPSLSNDTEVDASVTWAFVSWRPTNDLLLRAGRLRIPLYLTSENTDVGATFDFARLPTEVYSTSPTTNFDGVFLSKTWSLAGADVTLDGYLGSARTHLRSYLRDTSEVLSSPFRVSARGLVLTMQLNDNTFRAGAHDAYAKSTTGQSVPVTYPFVSILPGVGYYQVSDQLPGPGVPTVREIHSPAFTVGADVAVGDGFRVVGEYVRRHVRNVVSGSDTQGAYLAVLKPIGAWTPYVSVARLLTMRDARTLYGNVNRNTVPGFIPGAALINASQRAGADGIAPFDQSTWTIGTSYRLSPTSKLKAEWARVRVGEVSALIDAPPGGESGNTVVNILSMSYNFAF